MTHTTQSPTATPTKDLSKQSQNFSANVSPKPRLESKTLQPKIKVHISTKLQDQVRFLCDRISKDEWSGVLFYTTEGGTYGDPEFKIIAQELYLMDIGNGTYTEYKIGPDVIKHMMDNKELLTMKKGHIHSHNHMDVFFSPTDTDEIETNSEFHNFYFSLIVNNRNHMCAKIAHRHSYKRTSTENVSFRDITGKLIEQEVTNVDYKTIVNIYECEILKPYFPGKTFATRYTDVKGLKEAENKQKFTHFQGTHKVVDDAPKSMGQLFKEIRENKDNKIVDVTALSTPGKLFNTNLKSTPFHVDNDNIRLFLIHFLGKGVKNQSLAQVIGNLKKRMSNGFDIVGFLKEQSKIVFSSYNKYFPEDHRCNKFDERLVLAQQYITVHYGDTFPTLTHNITSQLKNLKIASTGN